MAKRRRVGSAGAGAPDGQCCCPVAPLVGTLSDNVDVLATMAKLVCMALSEDAFALVNKALHQMRLASPDGVIRFASLCTGSGLGDLALHEQLRAFERMRSRDSLEVPHMECSFL